MSAGAHALELASYVEDGTVLESARSSPLRVIVSPAASATNRLAPLDPKPAETSFSTADGVRLRVALVAQGLDEPTDLAAAPDGRVFVAERRGRVRIFRDNDLQPAPALTLPEVSTTGQSGLLAITIDPRFDKTHFVYAIYTTTGRQGGSVFTLARFREIRDTLADRAVLLDNVPASSPRPAVSLRFGPDGKLYAAFDDGGDSASAGDLASFNGKILRMNADGSTPDDQIATPVWSFEYRSPRGFDWQPATGSIWIADSAANRVTRLSAVAASSARAQRGATVSTFRLPSLPGASALAFYGGSAIPALRGDLLIGSDEGRHILRIRFDPRDATRVVTTERLLQDAIGGIRALAVDRSGAIYVSTSDALAKITAAE
jgi:glucose/arabinose dehydrogenase